MRLSLDLRKTNLAVNVVCLPNWLPGASPALVKEWRMGKSNEGCLKIQPLPRERFKFSTRDGSSPASETLGPRVARHTVPLTQPRSSTPGPWPPGPCVPCPYFSQSHECSSCKSASGGRIGWSEMKAIPNSPFLGSAALVARPGEHLARNIR